MEEIRIVFGILSGCLLVAGALPYIIDVWNNRTRPNVISWAGWTFLTVITTVAQVAKGADLSIIVPIASTIGTGIVATLGVRYGYTKFSILDKTCFTLGIIAILVWILTKEPLTAIVISVIADILFLLPTSVKAYREPNTETAFTYILFATGAFLGLLSSAQLDLQDMIYPIYLMVAYSSTTCILLIRRKFFVS